MKTVSKQLRELRYDWDGSYDGESNPFQDHAPDLLTSDPNKKPSIDATESSIFLGPLARDKSPGGILQAMIHLGCTPFLNTRSLGFEIVRDGVHSEMTKEVAAHLRGLMRTNFSYPNTNRKTKNHPGGVPNFLNIGSDEFTDALYAICADRPKLYRGDPFQMYYRSLPEWDNENRIADFVETFFDVPEEYQNVAKWASKFLFLGAIHRSEHPGAKLDTAPIFAGESHLGKSTLISLLFPEQERVKWFTDDFSLISRDSGKDQIESTLGSVIVEISEMVGYRKADIDTLKAMLSRRVDKKRLAYRRDPETIPRRFIFVGTSNDMHCIPNDPSDALKRRLPVVPVLGMGLNLSQLEEGVDLIRDQLWAEAWHRFQQGESAALLGETEREVISLGENHRMADDEMENLLARFERSLPAGVVFKTLQELGVELELVRRVSVGLNADSVTSSEPLNWGVKRSLTDALRNRNWVRKTRRIDGVLSRGWEKAIIAANPEVVEYDDEVPF